MKTTHKLLLAIIPVIGLAACGGGDTEDRLDVADPVVRLVHASPIAPNVTLFRDTVALPDATNAPYKFASNYFDVSSSLATYSVRTTVGDLLVGSEAINPARGNRYTVVALSATSTDASTYVIVDPYNKPLNSSSARLRVMNASFNASNIDVYMNAVGTDITPPSVAPFILGTAYKTSGPLSGADSAEIGGGTDIPGGSYQVTITTAGTKTILFKGQLTFPKNADVLLLTVPDSLTTVKALVKIEGTAGATDVAAI